MANLPSLFDESPFGLFDPFREFRFPDIDSKLYGKHASRVMKTDIREDDKSFELLIDLPGFKKDEIQAELKDGYLTISASKSQATEDKKEGRVIRSERMTGNCSRSFYVGEAVHQEDCKASFEDGVLTVTVPKVVPEKSAGRISIA